jgi:hypothetical protein
LKNILQKIKAFSVNLEESVVEKIKSNGVDAICCRAEDVEKYNINPDIFMSFEMLEHLINPIQFLKDISDKSSCKYFAITVPYVSQSRIALGRYLNDSMKKKNAEGVHIFELSPKDWKQIFKFSGWKVVYEQIYTQYPKKGLYKYTKSAWKKYDFEGFYGVILEKDDTYKKLYQDWE